MVTYSSLGAALMKPKPTAMIPRYATCQNSAQGPTPPFLRGVKAPVERSRKR